MIPHRHLSARSFPRSIYALAGVAAATLALSQAQAGQISATPQPIFPDLQVAGIIDFDGDGRMEIIGTEVRTGRLQAYHTDATGRPILVRVLADAGLELSSVAAGDMDGDGTLDLVAIAGTGTGTSRTVGVFYDGGGDLFEPFAAIEDTSRTDQLLATDFDGDGMTDLLIYPASERLDNPVEIPDAISLIKNLGAGNFDPAVWVMSFPEALRNAAPSDVDLDGDMDFVAVRPAFGTLVVARNTGTVFEVSAVPSSESNIRDLAVGDVNGDGAPDVVTLRTASPMGGLATVELYLGLPGGTTSAPIVVLADEQDSALDVSLLDLDGDGALDIVSSRLAGALGQPHLVALTGDGVGGFAAPTLIPVAPGTQVTRSLTGDVSGDGRGDLLQGVKRDSQFSLSAVSTVAFLGGTGASGSLLAREVPFATFADNGFATGDLNGDGVVDVVTRRYSQAVALLGLANSDYFRAPVTYTAAPFDFAPILMADVDQDGRDDVIGASPTLGNDETIGVLLTSVNVVGSAYFPIGDYPIVAEDGLVAVDWDGDGDLDLTVNANGTSGVKWHENQGGGLFSGARDIVLSSPLVDTWRDLAIGDFNGDGRPDLAVAASVILVGDHDLAWYEGLGSGVFRPKQVLTPSLGPIASGDLNGDGLADVVFVDTESGPTTTIAAVFGSPSGLTALSRVTLVLDAANGDGLELEDVNGDGSRDLVLLADDGSSVAYFAGAAGAFEQTSTPLSAPMMGANGQPVADARFDLVDVGGDGDTDMVVGTQHAGVVWHENTSLDSAGSSYCGPAALNSIGASGRMLALGSNFAPLNNVQLHAVDLPPLVFGFFIASQTATPATPAAGSSGLICVGGQVGRFVGPGEVQNTGFYGGSQVPGAMSLRIDLTSIPTPLGFVAVAPGSTWNFQAWHRDSSAQGVTSNFTDAVSVTF
jgi:hypothetical protein